MFSTLIIQSVLAKDSTPYTTEDHRRPYTAVCITHSYNTYYNVSDSLLNQYHIITSNPKQIKTRSSLIKGSREGWGTCGCV